MKPPNPPFTFVLAGAGRVGTAVAVLLARRGHRPAGVWSRTPDSSARAMRLLNAPQVTPPGPSADVLLVGVSDAAIAEITARFAPALRPGAVAVHFAGALALEPLAPAATTGAATAALHPVAACPSIEAALDRLPGAAWGVTCSPGLESWSEDFVVGVGGIPLAVPAEHRPAWHAAAVMTSNGVAALLASGEAILSALGVDEPLVVLESLTRGTIANAAALGGGAPALTGPIVRGEDHVVASHLAVLRELDPALADVYRRASRLIAAAAVAGERLGSAAADRVIAVLEGE